jgi:hypothetical protein
MTIELDLHCILCGCLLVLAILLPALKSLLMGTPTGYNFNILLKAASREKGKIKKKQFHSVSMNN